MVFGNPELNKKYPSFALSRKGAVFAQLKGDPALAACLTYFGSRDYHHAIAGSPARRLATVMPPKLHLPPPSPRKGTLHLAPKKEDEDNDGAAAKHAVDVEKLTARLHPPAPVPRPPPREKRTNAAADEAFAERFDGGGRQKEQRTAAKLNKRYMQTARAARVAPKAVEGIVHRLAEQGVEHVQHHREELRKRWLAPTYRSHTARSPPTRKA